MDRNRAIVGYLLVIAGSALFATKAIFIKLAYVERADALLMLAWRMAIALPIFVAIGILEIAKRRHTGQRLPAWRTIGAAVLVGLVGYYVAMILDFAGLLYVSAQLERLTLFTYPVFLIFIGAAFFGMRLTRGSVMAAAISYAGLAIVFLGEFSDAGSNIMLGTLLVLGSALSFAVYQLLAKHLIADVGSTLFTSLALSGASLATLAHVAIWRGGLDTSVSHHYLMLAAGTGLLATVIPAFLVNAGMARVGAASTAMISNISPLFTIYLAVALLGETFTLADAAGTALVVGGIGFHTWRDLRRPASGGAS